MNLVTEGRQRLTRLGMMAEGKDGTIEWKFHSAKAPTEFEQSVVERFNAAVLAELVLPGKVQALFHRNFVDQRLTTPKEWRDVFRPDGGWTRYHPHTEKTEEFTKEGRRVLAKDEEGKPTKTEEVVYRQEALKGKAFVNSNPLKAHSVP